MSTSTLPKIKDAQKKAEDSRYYMLRANRQMTTLALNRIRDQLDSERVDFNARVKQQSLELKMELLRRAEEEKAILKADEDMLLEVNIKIAKRRKKRADEFHQQEVRKKEIRRRIEAKRKDQRFERKVIPEEEEETKDMLKAETTGGGHRPSLLPILASKNLPDDLDIYMPRMVHEEKREPRIQLNLDLIFPNARKPKLYKQLMSQNFRRETSRINEKSLRKLKEKYLTIAAAEEAKQHSVMDDPSNPYISSISNMMYHVAEDSRQSHMSRLLRQVSETRDTLRVMAPRLPMSDRLKQTLEECVRQKKMKKGRKRGAKGRDRKPKSGKSAKSDSSSVVLPANPESDLRIDKDIVRVSTQKKPSVKFEEVNEEEERQKEVQPSSTSHAFVAESKVKFVDAESLNEQTTESDERLNEGELSNEQESKTGNSTESNKDSSNDIESQSEEKIWRLPVNTIGRSRNEDSAMKRVTLKGPILTPIQSTDVSPEVTREPTLESLHENEEGSASPQLV